jgi:hypothetical protein
MGQVEDILAGAQNFRSAAGAQAYGVADENPDDAAQAINLSNATGAPAAAIHANLDEFRAQTKASASADIVRNNAIISNYVASHPLAASVSNDDWPMLDRISRQGSALRTAWEYLNPSRIGKAISQAQSPLTAAAILAPPGVWDAVHGLEQRIQAYDPLSKIGQAGLEQAQHAWADADETQQIEAYQGPGSSIPPVKTTMRELNVVLQAMAAGMGFVTGTAGAAGTAVGGEQFGRDISAMTEYEMTKGEGAHVEVGPEAVAKVFKDRTDFAQAMLDYQRMAGVPQDQLAGVARLRPEAGVTEGKAPTPPLPAQAITDLPNYNEIAARLLGRVRPWVSNGKDVPTGLDPDIDKSKAQQNMQLVGKLEEIVDLAQNSETRNRSYEMFGNLVKGTFGDNNIGLSAEGALALYGDKIPSPDDGILGWVPNIAEQLDRARAVGSDILIPQADLVGRIDPALMRQMADHTRFFPGGVTKAELDATPPEAPKQIIGDLPAPRAEPAGPFAKPPPLPTLLDAALPQTRAAHSLEPMFAMGDRKLSLELTKLPTRDEIAQQRYGANFDQLEPHEQEWAQEQHNYVQRWTKGFGDKMDRYNINNERGEKVGELELVRGDGKLLVNMINGEGGLWSNSFGPALIMDLARQVKALYPDYVGADGKIGITGFRVSGARERAGATGVAEVRLDEGATPEALEAHEAFRQLLQDHFNVPSGWEVAGGPTQETMKGAEAEQNATWQQFAPGVAANTWLTLEGMVLANRLEQEVARLTGGRLKFQPVSGIRRQLESGQWTAPHGAYFPSQGLAIVDMMSPNPLGTLRHEVAHWMRKFLTREEWQALVDHAHAENWHGLFDIDERYRGARQDLKDEEAIVKGFQTWNKHGRPKGTNVSGIFQKIWDFLDGLREKLKDYFGGEKLEWEQIFQRMTSGEVGRRPETVTDAQVRAPKFSMDQLNNIRADSVGLTKKGYENYQKLVLERYRADLAAATERAQRQEKRRQTTEWKDNRAAMEKEVNADLSARRDVQADRFIGNGELGGVKSKQRFTLREADLTPEQKAGLPAHYVSKNGLPKDGVAGLVGYGSGDEMIRELTAYRAAAQGKSPMKAFQDFVSLETDRRMEAKYGHLDGNIMTEAANRAFSETDMNILHDGTMNVALRQGITTVDKEAIRKGAMEDVAKMKVGQLSSDSLKNLSARHGREAQRALAAQDDAKALPAMQAQTLAAEMANQVARAEGEVQEFLKAHKRYSQRALSSVAQDSLNWVHWIYDRVGIGKRDPRDIANELNAAASNTLEAFVKEKSMGMVEMPVWPELYTDFRRPMADLTMAEFRALKQSVEALIHNGREELKVYKGTEGETIANIREQMKEQLEKLGTVNYTNYGGKRSGAQLPRTLLASHLQLENVFNRWDEFDPMGVWNQYGIRPLIEGSNNSDALRKQYSERLRELGKADRKARVNLYQDVENPLFRQPDDRGATADETTGKPTGPLIRFNRANLRIVMLNMGNDSNFVKMAKGYGLERAAIKAWVDQHATKADWEFVQGVWNIFSDIKVEADRMYRHLTGVAPESIPAVPITGMHGTYAGGYFPVIWHEIFKGNSPKLFGLRGLDEGTLGDQGYTKATTPAGYTINRVNYAAPISLSFDAVPNRMMQMLHDIALRPAVINANKFFGDAGVRRAIRNHAGKEYEDLLDPYLRDVANVQNFMSKSQAEFETWSSFLRQNMVSTLIGIPTAMKHLPTAMVLSMKEVGPLNWLKALKSLVSIDPVTGERNYQFAMRSSEELQRRDRNAFESLYGATGTLSMGAGRTAGGQAVAALLGQRKGDQFDTLRSLVQNYASKPIAWSDKFSSVPTWLAAYEKAMKEGNTHGDGVYLADRAVRRAHGSSAITSKPQAMRTMSPWFTTFFNFFNDIGNRQVEALWRAGDNFGLTNPDKKIGAMRAAGVLSADMFAYVLWPAIIEQMVSPMDHDQNTPYAIRWAEDVGMTLCSSWVGVRDIANAVMNGKDPSVGLWGSATKEITDILRDITEKKKNNEWWGKVIKDSLGAGGLLGGVVPLQAGSAAKYLVNVGLGAAHPRDAWDWLQGLRYGTNKKHSSGLWNYIQGLSR